MSLSRPFILRPVATSLLMVGMLLAGVVAYRQLPVSALPAGGLSDDPGRHVLSRRQPGRDGVGGHRAARAAVRPGARAEPDDLDQLRGRSVITLQFVLDLNIDVAEQEVQAAINAAGTYLPPDLPNPPIYSKTNPADAPILTLALTSTALPLSKVEDLADTRLAQKISQLPGVGLVSISGGQKPAVRIQVNPTALSSYGLTLEDVRSRRRGRQRQPGQGQLRRPAAVVHDRRQRSAAGERTIPAAGHRLPERRAGAALGRRRRWSTTPRTSGRRPG